MPMGDSLLARRNAGLSRSFRKAGRTKTSRRKDHCDQHAMDQCGVKFFGISPASLRSDPTLRPRDAIVMMPDPEGYAPTYATTFEGMEEGMPDYFLFRCRQGTAAGKSIGRLLFDL